MTVGCEDGIRLGKPSDGFDVLLCLSRFVGAVEEFPNRDARDKDLRRRIELAPDCWVVAEQADYYDGVKKDPTRHSGRSFRSPLRSPSLSLPFRVCRSILQRRAGPCRSFPWVH